MLTCLEHRKGTSRKQDEPRATNAIGTSNKDEQQGKEGRD